MKYFYIFGLEYSIRPTMNKKILVILIFLVVAFGSCKEEKQASYMTNLKAAEYFEKVEQICNTERADLWGINLYGPLMMIDRVSREVYANVQDAEGLLKPKDGIFVGTFPKELIIGTIPVEYGGTLFAMATLRSDEDEYRIKTRCVHALFHCAQIKKGIVSPDYRASHLNEKTARLWVKLEWRALQRAIRTTGETRTQAIRDALVFRSARREMYPRFIKDENYFENNEGTTAFTYIYLCNEPGEEYFSQLQNFYNRYNTWSFPYAWGYINGALYSHLLLESDFDFKSISGIEIDLGKIIKDRYEIILPEISRDIAGSLAFNYDIDLINQEELEREVRLREERQKIVSKFVDRPVIYLELESPNFSFEPGDMTTVDSLGTIYETLIVSDNWGKITVDEGGCLVSPGLEFIRIPAKNIKEDRNHISGEGWHIILNDSWHMEEFEDSFIVTKLLP